jgi:hypothetical protein
MRLIVALIFAAFSAGSMAQEVSDSMRKDILELMEVTGSMKLGEQVGNAVSGQIINAMRTQQPDTPQRTVDIVLEVTREHMSRFMNDPATIDGFVALYARHFTQEDIQAITAFYKTPAGAKMASQTPKLTTDSMQFAQSRMAVIIPAMQQDLMQRLQAENLVPQPGQ